MAPRSAPTNLASAMTRLASAVVALAPLALVVLAEAAWISVLGGLLQLDLAAVDGSLRFRVEDTGVGFDARSQGTGIGISSMSERMAAIGGHLRIVSQPGCGTVVTGWIPFDQM